MSFISSLGEWLRKVSKSFMSATISGKTITLTRHNGDTVTLTTQDTTYEQASQSTSGLMSVDDKKKLDDITAGAEPNQNAFASVLVDNTNVVADTKSDTLTLVAGNNITLTADATNDKITIAAKDTVTTVTTTGSGNAITSITASNGALTAKKDSTFLLANANAVSASKLNTAKTISAGDLEYEGSASFDGSGNVNLNITPYKAIVNIGNTNNYPFHYIGTTGLLTSSFVDDVITLFVGRDFVNGGGGICRIEVRTNNVANGNLAECQVKWLVRDPDLPVDCVQVGFRNTSGDTIADIFYYSAGAYGSAIFRVLGVGNRTSIARTFTLVDSKEVSNTTASNAGASVNSFKTIAAAATALHSSKPYTSTIIATDVHHYSAANGTGYIKLANGKQITHQNIACADIAVGATAKVTVTFPRAFKDTHYSISLQNYKASSSIRYAQIGFNVYSLSTTSITIYVANNSTEVIYAPFIDIIVIGEGA